MSDPAILIEGLTKQYGSTTAVDDLTLTVASDEIYGSLGPNGAGKSTTIGMLMDYIRPTTGSISHNAMSSTFIPASVFFQIGTISTIGFLRVNILNWLLTRNESVSHQRRC